MKIPINKQIEKITYEVPILNKYGDMKLLTSQTAGSTAGHISGKDDSTFDV